MAPQEVKTKFKGCNFPVNETLSKLYKVDNFMLTKEFMQK